MGEISRVVIGIAIILSVVFVPMIFFGGSSGVIYRQFAVTPITSMSLSAVIALIFTPALCVTILKRQAHKDIHTQKGFLVGLTAFSLKPVVVMRILLVKPLMPNGSLPSPMQV